MKKILVTTSNFNYDLLNNLLDNSNLNFEVIKNPYKRKLTEDEVIELVKNDVIGIIAGVERLSEKVLKAANSLRVISRCGIGLDSVDLITAKNLNISVFNTPDAPTIPVAELTICHILNLLRKVSISNKKLLKGIWEPQMGALLNAKTVGIIGFGRIGKQVSLILNAFGSKVIFFDPFINQDFPNALKVDLSTLLSTSDIITLHIPYSNDLHHMISEKELNLMKENSLIINISRGGLIDESALFNALKNNKILGAGIDCFEIEPYNGPLIELDNVLLTPHMGSYAKESRYNQELESIKNLIAFLKK